MKENLILIDSWFDAGVDQRPGVIITKFKCPACPPTRTNKKDKSLSVNFKLGVGKCHYCNTSFKVKDPENFIYQKPVKVVKDYLKPKFPKVVVSDKTVEFFKSRGVSKETLDHYQVTGANEYMPAKDGEHNGEAYSLKAGITYAIAFNYYFNGEHVNTKFRASAKRFKMVSRAMLTFYGIDFVEKHSECSIQEGEIDTLSAFEAGVPCPISVPNGASLGNLQLEYLDNCIDKLEHLDKIIIATDGDSAGRALSAELIRRLGAERCFQVEYPEGCKDTNEVLLKYGAQAVRDMYAQAKPVPVQGIFSDSEVEDSVLDLYDNGFPVTCKVGYPKFDKLLSFLRGQLTTVTGVPGHGKTTFIDQILVRLAARFDWRTLVFSPEYMTPLQVQKLIQKFIGKPAFGKNRMSREEMKIGLEFMTSYFYFMKYDEVATDIDGILDKAREMVIRKGINALVIDPYNCIEHKIPKGYTETQYISELLTKITSFAKRNQVHVFLVAHPTKLDKDKNTGKYEVPTLYKISGSANFFNKTDNGMTIYLHDMVEVHVQKVKFDFVGQKGMAEFYYEPETGRYREIDQPQDNEYEIYKKRLEAAFKERNLLAQAELTFQETVKDAAPDAPAIKREPGVLTRIENLIPGSYEPPF